MLSNKEIYKIEMIKLVKRKDIWMMLTMIGIPMLYSIGVYFESNIIVYNGSSREYALSFATNMFQFVYMVFIYVFLISLSTSKSLASEIDSKNILLYTQRINNRKQIYIQKGLSLISVFSIICLLFYIVSIVMFYIFVARREDIAINMFLKREELLKLLCSFVTLYLLYLFIINFSLMLSSIFKQNNVLIITSITFIVFIYLQSFPYVQYLSPTYYINQIMEVDPLDLQGIVNVMLPCLITNSIYALIFNIVGIKKFRERDL